MGRLGGFSYRDVAARLTRHGFIIGRQAKGSHEGWINPQTGRTTTVPRHGGDVPEGTLRSILKQAGISADDFLAD